MTKISIKGFYRNSVNAMGSVSLRLKLFMTMALAVIILAGNLLIFFQYHYQINQLNGQVQQIEKIMPQLIETLYIKNQFEKSISRSDSQRVVANIDSLKNNIYILKKSFVNNALILNSLNKIDDYAQDFSVSSNMFIETKNQEKNYNQAMEETLSTLLKLIESAKKDVSSIMLSKEADVNSTKSALTSYEYLTTLTRILINTDAANEEKLLEQLDVSNKLADQMIALNLRDKGLQISAYSQQLYSDWKVLKSARDFETSTDANLTNIIDGVNINAKAAVDNISRNLKEKENTASTFLIILFISSTIVFFLLAYISTKRTSYRFKMLISATEQIADGDFSVNFIPKDGDEIDLLGKHIYHMSKNLQGYKKSLLETNANLEKANTHLEEAVLERTRQLEEARDKLLIVNEELELDKRRFQLLATTDSLTYVKNRGAIMNLIDDEIKRFPNYKKPFCIILFDIDDFKKVNDKYGHTIGDEVLIEITNLIQATIRDTDCVGRYGGEEFLILLPNTPLETTKIIIENILLKLRATPLSSKLLPIRISGGLIQYKSGIIDEVIQRVDDLLYKSKQNGKDQFNW